MFWRNGTGGRVGYGGMGDGPFHRLVSSDFDDSGAKLFVLVSSTIGDQVLGW